ncbi:hypothetical protein OUZ56_018899 [Daphnia magna]|uniref:Uncharacterized protein n=1 Tax=Daphnia magna TaxID=35525 RepID=A0ABQ9ZA87_9CRUS|nr:hypothetical protein OUZ56_018899 [Daphnia magna]
MSPNIAKALFSTAVVDVVWRCINVKENSNPVTVGYCRSLALPCSPCRSESNKTLTSSVTYRYRPIFSSFAINPAFFLKLANCHV